MCENGHFGHVIINQLNFGICFALWKKITKSPLMVFINCTTSRNIIMLISRLIYFTRTIKIFKYVYLTLKCHNVVQYIIARWDLSFKQGTFCAEGLG